MPRGFIFNDIQRKFYHIIQKHIKDNQISNPGFRSSPFRYIIHRLDQVLFGSENDPHEKCTLITEEVLNSLILESLSFQDFAQVVQQVDIDFQDKLHEQGVLLFSNLHLRLIKHISNKLKDSGITNIPLSHIEELLLSNMRLHDNFDPTDIRHYEAFLDNILNSSNKIAFLNEAKAILSTVVPITWHTSLVRSLAHAIVKKVDPTPGINYGAQVEIEAKTCSLLYTVAAKEKVRQNRVLAARKAFALKHPYRNAIINVANTFNEKVSHIISYVYVFGVTAIFVTREHDGSAHRRAEEDVIQVLRNQGINLTFHHDRSYNPALNQNSSLTNCTGLNNIYNTITNTNATCNGTDVVVYGPRHLSEYFPENQGVLNGLPSYMTSVISTIQLTLTLPNIILGQHKRHFILEYFKQHRPSEQEQRDDMMFLSTVTYRWFGNAIIQPVDCVDSPLKDLFFKWTIFRLFTPIAPLEEPLKIRSLLDRLNKGSYRTQGRRFEVNRKAMICSALAITACEYIDAAMGFPYVMCTALLKGTRLSSVLIPVIMNTRRGNVVYHRRFKRFIIANILRTASSPIVLTGFDLIGNTIRYVSLLTAFDVAATVNVDAVSSSILHEAAMVEENLLAIQDITDNILRNNLHTIVLLSPDMELRFQELRDRMTISEILEEDEEQVQRRRRERRMFAVLDPEPEPDVEYRYRWAVPTRARNQEVRLEDQEGVRLTSYRSYRQQRSDLNAMPEMDPELTANYLYQHAIRHAGRDNIPQDENISHHVRAPRRMMNADIYLEEQDPLMLRSYNRRHSIIVTDDDRRNIVQQEQRATGFSRLEEDSNLDADYFYQHAIHHAGRGNIPQDRNVSTHARAPRDMMNADIYLEEQDSSRLISYNRRHSIIITDDNGQDIVQQEQRATSPSRLEDPNLTANYIYRYTIHHAGRGNIPQNEDISHRVRAPRRMRHADIYLEDQDPLLLRSYRHRNRSIIIDDDDIIQESESRGSLTQKPGYSDRDFDIRSRHHTSNLEEQLPISQPSCSIVEITDESTEETRNDVVIAIENESDLNVDTTLGRAPSSAVQACSVRTLYSSSVQRQ